MAFYKQLSSKQVDLRPLTSPTKAIMLCKTIQAGALSLIFSFVLPSKSTGATLTGRVVDAASGQPLPARIYLIDESGRNHFAETTDASGTALPYREQWVPMTNSQDRHTTLSAHPFTADLPSGTYTIEVHRGKEYFPYQQEIHVASDPIQITVPLRRWINMPERGWYSGETHVHRRHFELANVMLAEDLNMAFPVTFWTTTAYEAPHTKPSTLRRPPSPFGNREDRGIEPIRVDANHIIVPRNTEYEIFSIGEQRHTLGAVFIINHKSKFRSGMPPVREIAKLAHAEGALLDLDKHSWPWSLMLPPVAGVDLFELSNNSVWQTRFGFSRTGQPPSYMEIETTDGHMTERGWLDYGFQCYYALLNCGLRMTPTAGTASGVHPVPLGFSRAYVHLDQPLTTEAWLAGLKRGRSFVTTGPMLFATVNGQLPSSASEDALRDVREIDLRVAIHSANPVIQVDLLVNGDLVASPNPQAKKAANGAYETDVEFNHKVDTSAWIVARCFTRLPNGRERFAHSAPFYVNVPKRPIRPKREEIAFLTQRMRDEIARNKKLLPPAALDEFKMALQFYENLQPRD